MLVLARKEKERIVIADEIELCVVKISGDRVRIGITAPKSVTVHRHEVAERIKLAESQARGGAG